MSFHVHLYDNVLKEHRQDLRCEAERQRMLDHLPLRSRSVGRQVVGRLGAALVALGSRMEQFEHRSEPVLAKSH